MKQVKKDENYAQKTQNYPDNIGDNDPDILTAQAGGLSMFQTDVQLCR